MPQRRVVEQLDDLDFADGEEVEATEVREWTTPGGDRVRNFFTEAHAKQFDDDLLRYSSVAEVITDKPAPARARRSSGSGEGGGVTGREKAQNRSIREWCKEQGMKISDRGRIPDDALQAYFAAHPGETPVRSPK